jgi:uncharacterized oxidoreductase
MNSWTGRTVLLTGATRGIGAAMCGQLRKAGATVLAVARDGRALTRLAEENPGTVHVLEADLADPAMPRAVARWVTDAHPRCDTLINNAAVMRFPVLTEGGENHLDAIAEEITIDLTAPLQIATALLPVLAANGPARLVNVSSGLGVAPKTDAPVYCAAKAGLRSFTRTLRYQVEDAGLPITVSEAVLPAVDTTLSRGDSAGKMTPEDCARAILAGTAAGQPEIWIGKARTLRWVMRLSPSLAHRIMRRM